MEDVTFRRAYDYSCKLLKLKDRSEYELAQKLEEKGFSRDIILKVIEKLKNNSYLDDRKFTLNYIEKQLKKIKSISLIIKELEEKYKISKEILNNIDIFSYKIKQLEILKNLINKKFKTFDKEKIYRYLLLRGFEDSEIEFLISNLRNEDFSYRR